MSRTIDDIETEERKHRDRLIEIDVELTNLPYPDGAYDIVQQRGLLAPGKKTPADLRNEKQVVQRQLAALEGEKKQLSSQSTQSTSKPRSPSYGELDEIVEDLIKRYGLKPNATVPSTKISAWVREYEGKGILLNDGSIRKKLSEKGYSKEAPRGG
jgi:hypothetical protein